MGTPAPSFQADSRSPSRRHQPRQRRPLHRSSHRSRQAALVAKRLAAMASPPAPPSCLPRTPKPTNSISSNFSMSTPPPTPPKLNSSTKSPTPLGASTASPSSKPNCSPNTLDPHEYQIPLLARLGLHGSRLSRQFQKAIDQLRDIQQERRHWSAAISTKWPKSSIRHQRKGLPFDPVFSRSWLRFFKGTN